MSKRGWQREKKREEKNRGFEMYVQKSSRPKILLTN